VSRLREAEARRVITEELARTGWDTASTFTVQEGRRPATEAFAWWHANTPGNEAAETAHSLAYLRAYLKIGGPKLYAGGLFLERRRLWMDRSIISRLERDGYLRFAGEGSSEPYLELTPAGEDLIA
jgi:hypothetical protein